MVPLICVIDVGWGVSVHTVRDTTFSINHLYCHIGIVWLRLIIIALSFKLFSLGPKVPHLCLGPITLTNLLLVSSQVSPPTRQTRLLQRPGQTHWHIFKFNV